MRINLFGRTFEFRSSLANPDKFLTDYFGGGRRTQSGTSVDEFSAMQYSAVWGCVLVLAQSLASLPLITYRRLPNGGKERATDHWAYNLLKTSPSPEISSYNWRAVAQGHAASWGNSYSKMVTNAKGEVIELWPMLPNAVRVKRINGRKWFYYTPPGGKEETLSSDEVLHIPGFGYDGTTGYSVISMHKEAIGLGQSTESFGARFFGSGTNPGTVFTKEGTLGDVAHKRLSEELKSKAGLAKAFDGLLLEDGLKMEKLGIPPEDAQFLETRKFQVNDIARIFRVPPHMIGDLEKATFSNIEQQSLDFVTNTLQPWLTLWEQELTRQLLSPVDIENGIFIEFLLAGLLRGDIKARYEAYNAGRMGGWLSVNEIRSFESMNPIDGGDEYLVPLNMAPADGDDGTRSTVPFLRGEKLLTTRSKQATEEKRAIEIRSLTKRMQLEKTHLKQFKRAAEAVVNREVKAVAKAAKKNLEERSEADFKSFLDDFYADLPRHIEREFGATIETFAELIQAEAAREVGGAVGMTDDLEEFVASYLETFSLRWVSSSRGQLDKILDTTEPEDVLDAITTRLDEWEEKKPEKVATNEVVRTSGAVVVASYAAAGVTKKRWVTVGDNCPFCDELDGMIVDIEVNFVEAGDDIKAQGRDGPLTVRGNHAHPPIHQGCDCQIVAE